MEARGPWLTMADMLEAVTYHLPRYENIINTYKTSPGQDNPSNLTFATKFVAIYLFAYHCLTADMVSAEKEKGD